MLQPLATQSTQQQHLRKTFLRDQLGGILGIGIILDMGQNNNVVILLLRAGSRIKIAHYDIGLAAQRSAIAVACVTGDDEIIRAQQLCQFRRNRAGGKDHTTGHKTDSSFFLDSWLPC